MKSNTGLVWGPNSPAPHTFRKVDVQSCPTPTARVARLSPPGLKMYILPGTALNVSMKRPVAVRARQIRFCARTRPNLTAPSLRSVGGPYL